MSGTVRDVNIDPAVQRTPPALFIDVNQPEKDGMTVARYNEDGEPGMDIEAWEQSDGHYAAVCVTLGKAESIQLRDWITTNIENAGARS